MNQSSVLNSLYPEELYAIPSPVFVIVNKPWADITENERMVLTRMLVAVKLSLASVQILTKKEFTIQVLVAFAPGKVLAFGATLPSAPKLYEHQVIDGTSLIVSESLDHLDDVKKKNLWLALRQMFNI